MLIKFNFDPVACVDELQHGNRTALGRMEAFLQFWRRHGILAAGPANTRMAMVQALQEWEDISAIALVMQALRAPSTGDFRRWERDRDDVPLQFINTEPQMAQYGRRFDLAVLTIDHAERLAQSGRTECRHDLSCASVHCGNVSVITFPNFQLACLVKDLINQEDWVIPIRYSQAQIWQARFKPYSHYAHTFVLVDPFITDTYGNAKTSLIRVLASLEADPNVKEHLDVVIYSTIENDASDTGSKLESDLRSGFSSGKLSIDVHLYDNNEGSLARVDRFPRDRWLRFDGIAFKLHGIDTLGSPVPGDSCDMQQDQAVGDLLALENELYARRLGTWLRSFQIP